jgi:hypothetical protein
MERVAAMRPPPLAGPVDLLLHGRALDRARRLELREALLGEERRPGRVAGSKLVWWNGAG